MTKSILFILTLIACSIPEIIFGQAEPLEIYNSKGEMIENGSLLFATDLANSKMISTDTLYVKNISGSSLNLKIRKIEEIVAVGTFNKFEALAQFMLPDESITPNSWELAEGEFLPENAYFHASFYPQSIISTSNVIYSFLSVGDKNQVIDSVYIVYAFSNTSITPFNSNQEPLYHREVLINCSPVETHEYSINLYNHTDEDVDYRVGKIIEEIEPGHDLSFWFGGIKYESDENSSNGEGVRISAETILEGGNGFKAVFIPNGVDGNQTLTRVKYKFFNRIDGRDVDFVTLIYNPSGVGFPKTPSFAVSKAYPNPASDFFNIDFHLPQFEKALLKLYQSNGNLLKQYPISITEGRMQISVKGLAAGLYYYSVEIDGKPMGLEKLIID